MSDVIEVKPGDEEYDDIQVVPEQTYEPSNPSPPHQLDRYCWCKPFVVEVSGGHQVIHEVEPS